MEEKVKYAVFLAVVILVSLSTSYITTVALKPSPSNSNITNNPQQSTSTNSTENIIHALSYQTYFDPWYNNGGSNYVTVNSAVAIYNLTITYQYTCLNNGTTLEAKVDYGTFYPSWDQGIEVQAGEIPYTNYVIPNYIVNACSSVQNNQNGYPIWNVSPQLNVTDVSGFA